MSVSVKETDRAYIFTGDCRFLTKQDVFQMVFKEVNLILSSKPFCLDPRWCM